MCSSNKFPGDGAIADRMGSQTCPHIGILEEFFEFLCLFSILTDPEGPRDYDLIGIKCGLKVENVMSSISGSIPQHRLRRLF